jgi:glycosyltransferase involved in cell wall biosynthesis
MRIAQVAPLWERVPPPAYGGTELVVAHLANELVKRGHEVTLFATADSHTLAKLVPGAPQPMRLAGVTPNEYQIYDLMQLTRVVQHADEFDVIHFHVDASALPYGNILKTPVVHTVHGILNPLAEKLFAQNRHQNFVSISDSQRRNDLGLNYVSTVYNGIDPSTYEFHPKPDEPPYLAFFGRISYEKGPHLAIELAKRTGWRLVMAGKVDRADQAFYESEVKPLIDGEQIVYVGEANHAQKSEIMGGAVATLCLLTWEEPFGLVMPESMVCGTPVIAMARGSAPELIVHEKTGFLCNTMDECVDAVNRIYEIDRKACREHVEQNFSHTRMIEGYEAVYYQLMKQRLAKNGHLRSSIKPIVQAG